MLRLTCLALCMAVTLAAKGALTPQLTLGLSRDALESGVMGVLEPSLKWTFANSKGDYDFEVRISIT
jgi:hypothetical protein